MKDKSICSAAALNSIFIIPRLTIIIKVNLVISRTCVYNVNTTDYRYFVIIISAVDGVVAGTYRYGIVTCSAVNVIILVNITVFVYFIVSSTTKRLTA